MWHSLTDLFYVTKHSLKAKETCHNNKENQIKRELTKNIETIEILRILHFENKSFLCNFFSSQTNPAFFKLQFTTHCCTWLNNHSTFWESVTVVTCALYHNTNTHSYRSLSACAQYVLDRAVRIEPGRAYTCAGKRESSNPPYHKNLSLHAPSTLTLPHHYKGASKWLTERC